MGLFDGIKDKVEDFFNDKAADLVAAKATPLMQQLDELQRNAADWTQEQIEQRVDAAQDQVADLVGSVFGEDWVWQDGTPDAPGKFLRADVLPEEVDGTPTEGG